MLALNYKTGELAWGYQQVHHDIWDFDSSTQPDMIDVEIGGKKVEGIVQANKDGWAYFVNAATGQPVFPIEEKPVPQIRSAAGHVPDAADSGDAAVQPTEGRRGRIEAVLTEAIERVGEDPKEFRRRRIVSGPATRAPVSSRPGENMVNRRFKEGRDGPGGARVGDEAYDPETGDYYVCSMFVPLAVSVESEKTNPTGGETYGTAKTGLFGPSRRERFEGLCDRLQHADGADRLGG